MYIDIHIHAIQILFPYKLFIQSVINYSIGLMIIINEIMKKINIYLFGDY